MKSTGVWVVLLLITLWSIPSSALESDYQALWCDAHNGKREVVLSDDTRVDCVTDTHVIEFDFGHKWAEAIGQALHYGALTGKRSGVVLIVTSSELRYVKRVREVAEYYKLPLDVWLMEKKDEDK